jgi:hypothetical protein
MADPKILSGMEFPFPVGDGCGEPVVGEGKEQRISIAHVGKGVEGNVESPTQEKGKDVPKGCFLENDEAEDEKHTPDGKGMGGPSNGGIPD